MSDENDRTTPESPFKNFRKETQNFFLETTAHGFNHIFEKRVSAKIRLFWITIQIFSIIGFILMCRIRVDNYVGASQQPTFTSSVVAGGLDEKSDSGRASGLKLPLPSLSICTEGFSTEFIIADTLKYFYPKIKDLYNINNAGKIFNDILLPKEKQDAHPFFTETNFFKQFYNLITSQQTYASVSGDYNFAYLVSGKLLFEHDVSGLNDQNNSKNPNKYLYISNFWADQIENFFVKIKGYWGVPMGLSIETVLFDQSDDYEELRESLLSLDDISLDEYCLPLKVLGVV